METKYQRIYKDIKTEINGIRSSFGYKTESTAFGHLMVREILDISDDEANESITDGGYDNGIDAIYIDKRNSNDITTHFFQFKFPASKEKIVGSPSQDEVFKLTTGFSTFIGNDEGFKSVKTNEALKNKRKEMHKIGNCEKYKIHIVNYMAIACRDNLQNFENELSKIVLHTGFNIEPSYYFAEEISKLREKNEFNYWPSFDIPYKKESSPFNDGNASVYSIYASVLDLYESFKPHFENLFSGNIRFYNPKSTINRGICDSLINDKKVFHLLNNGITIVCSKASYVTIDEKISIKRGSVINGAQTVGCINKIITDSLDKGEDIQEYKKCYISLKVIAIEEKRELIDKLVYTLNTQNKTVNSYAISNNSKMKSIQNEINDETEYYLELKPNEFKFEANRKAKQKKKDKLINIDLAIQCFAAFYNVGGLGYLSKNNKSALFDDDNIDKLLDEISKDKILKSVLLYKKIYALIKSYRAFLRDSGRNEILDTLNISRENIVDYSFINTGDFLILFACGAYERKHNHDSEYVMSTIIKTIANLIDSNVTVANQTRTKEMFDKVLESI